MLHPRLTPVGATIGGTSSRFLADVGPYGSWADLQFKTRWGDGASGMYEASWTMPLPAQFEDPILRRGSIIEAMSGPWRIGSPLILSEPTRGTGVDNPWSFVATGIGREVEGENSFYALDGSGNTTAIPSTAVDQAITRGWRIGGRAASVPTTAIGGASSTDELMSVGSLLNAADESLGQRHYVGQDNLLAFAADPTSPTYQLSPGAAALGTADDGYAVVVMVRYLDSADSTYKTVSVQDASAAATEGLFGRREYAQNIIDRGPMSTAAATAFANGILSLYKGRLAWLNRITVTSNEIRTMGGAPADLVKVAEDVGSGCMVRLHGVWSDLLTYNGQTWIDVVLGEANYVDGARTIDLSPAGLAPRDLAAILEAASAAAAAA